MAVFPALAPDTREYDIAGDFPMVEESAWPGVMIRYRTGYEELTAVGLVLTIGFNRRPIAEIMQIIDHYNGQQGGVIPFALPEVIWAGHTSPVVPVGTQWRYLDAPPQPAEKGPRGSTTVTLEAMAYLSESGDVVAAVPSAQVAAAALAPWVQGDPVAAVPSAQVTASALAPEVIGGS